ncbi:M1 family metallopeptidase [Roseivirga sp. BDSF3-8]|uniref:M1 family metallopeptidase n=1 Tax=Roseivirga sp. BDSF3-8 TaxID=3241598 RepID=UPI0035318F74
MGRLLLALIITLTPLFSFAQSTSNHGNKFEQLNPELRSPNVYRTASGAPGHQYWQQQADYKMEIELDDRNQRITGSETITYTNNSPDVLEYLWVQLDQNVRAEDADKYKIATNKIDEETDLEDLQGIIGYDFDGGFKISAVKNTDGSELDYTINKTMMRVELEQPLKPGDKFSFGIDWSYNINDRLYMGGRSGYEHFEENDNYLYTIAQFFPRMAVYSDVEGWQNKQFHGRGEFALPFGDYEVKITVPSDHMVGATGTLQNAGDVLTSKEMERWEAAKSSYDKPVIIRTESEAKKIEKRKSTEKSTWVFQADSVRDFAFASSRKFIWDAMAVDINGKDVMAMSYYPKEGNPLWEQYSTEVVAHTLKVYSRMTIDYPYPKAISVHAADIGMEYPMICFNFGRPEKDGTYTSKTKYGMIGVIIHEVGHNFFPMIVNSDERQWTWMDEGLNTFVQFITEQEWDRNYPSRRGPAHKIVDYMKSSPDQLEPIMTNSENIVQFGNNAYAKPATALNILRETVMGRELFDYAFKEYAERWAFKHPTPEDFFRTMEDASGVDLDWYWRGWFYSIDPVDIAIEDVKLYTLNTMNPEIENAIARSQRDSEKTVTQINNEKDVPETVVERKPELKDFYNEYDDLDVTKADVQEYKEFLSTLNNRERNLLKEGYNFYEVTFKNVGGLVMPLILEFYYEDGSMEKMHIPAEVWRMNEDSATKVFATMKTIDRIVMDPQKETADIDLSNNVWPKEEMPSRFDLFKEKKEANPMQKKDSRSKP